MYVVLGASGNTGGVVAAKLLSAGKAVRVVGRDAKRLERFTQLGAEAFVVDGADMGALSKAFSGAEAAYAMIPPNISAPDVHAYQEEMSDALASAIDKTGVKFVVVLSSIGADKPDRTGPVVGLHNLEKKLEGIAGLNALYLRPGYFMENILPQVGVIKSFGNMVGPVKGDLPLSLIATCDIGAAAAEALLKPNFEGKRSQELLGPRDLSYGDIAKITGAAIGTPGLGYRQVPGMLLKSALAQMGMSSSMIDLLLEMADALNSGHMKSIEARSPKNTTPTTLETFVSEVFVPAYRGTAV